MATRSSVFLRMVLTVSTSTSPVDAPILVIRSGPLTQGGWIVVGELT